MEWLSVFLADLQQSAPALWHGFTITLKVVFTLNFLNQIF